MAMSCEIPHEGASFPRRGWKEGLGLVRRQKRAPSVLEYLEDSTSLSEERLVFVAFDGERRLSDDEKERMREYAEFGLDLAASGMDTLNMMGEVTTLLEMRERAPSKRDKKAIFETYVRAVSIARQELVADEEGRFTPEQEVAISGESEIVRRHIMNAQRKRRIKARKY